MPILTKFLDWPSLQEFKNQLDNLFATKASLSDYQPVIDENNKLSKDLVSGLGTAAASDANDFATAAQGTKADEAIPNPSTKQDGQLLMYNSTQQKWVASDAPASGVITVTAGDSTVTVAGTLANPTVAVTPNTFDSYGSAAAVQGATSYTVKDAIDNAANAQSTADAAVVANADIVGATKTKITYDAKGLVTAGADLEATDIPALDATKITTGTFADARIASAATWNAKQDALQFTGLYDATTNKVVLADYVADAVALAANGGFEVVTILPEPTEANYKKRMIYLYQPAGASSYEEYIIARSGSGTEQDPYTYSREKLGDTDIQLTNYWAKAELTAITTAEVDSLFD